MFLLPPDPRLSPPKNAPWRRARETRARRPDACLFGVETRKCLVFTRLCQCPNLIHRRCRGHPVAIEGVDDCLEADVGVALVAFDLCTSSIRKFCLYSENAHIVQGDRVQDGIDASSCDNEEGVCQEAEGRQWDRRAAVLSLLAISQHGLKGIPESRVSAHSSGFQDCRRAVKHEQPPVQGQESPVGAVANHRLPENPSNRSLEPLSTCSTDGLRFGIEEGHEPYTLTPPPSCSFNRCERVAIHGGIGILISPTLCLCFSSSRRTLPSRVDSREPTKKAWLSPGRYAVLRAAEMLSAVSCSRWRRSASVSVNGELSALCSRTGKEAIKCCSVYLPRRTRMHEYQDGFVEGQLAAVMSVGGHHQLS